MVAKCDKVLKVCKIVMVVIVAAAGLYLWLGSSGVMAEAEVEVWNEFMSQFISVYNGVVMPTITTVGTMVLIIAGVFNFLKLKNSADEGEREKAKKAILWWLISVVGVVATLWATPNIINAASQWFPRGNIQ